MAIGISGIFDDDQNVEYDYDGGIRICGSDTRENLKQEQKSYDQDCSITGVHSCEDE